MKKIKFNAEKAPVKSKSLFMTFHFLAAWEINVLFCGSCITIPSYPEMKSCVVNSFFYCKNVIQREWKFASSFLLKHYRLDNIRIRIILVPAHFHIKDHWNSLIYSNYKVGNERLILNYVRATPIWKVFSYLRYIEM